MGVEQLESFDPLIAQIPRRVLDEASPPPFTTVDSLPAAAFDPVANLVGAAAEEELTPPETAYPVAADPARLSTARLNRHVATRGRSRRERPPVKAKGRQDPDRLIDPGFDVLPFVGALRRQTRWLIAES